MASGSLAASARTASAVLILAAWALSASPAGAYDIVTRGQGVLKATGLVRLGDAVVASTPAGRQSVPLRDVDFYETFCKNIGREGGNVVVFHSGSLLRYDTIQVGSGLLQLGLGPGISFSVPESLVDFAASVLEGATTRLPVGMGSGAVAMARGGGGGGGVTAMEASAAPDDTGGLMATAGPLRGRRPGRSSTAPPGSTRRGFPPPGSAELADQLEEGIDTSLGSSGDERPPEPDDFGSPDAGDSSPMDDSGSEESGRSSRFGSREDQNAAASGTVVLQVSTQYTGDNIAGLQVVIRYPPNCTVVTPVHFTGFAARMTAVPNTQNPFRIAGLMANPNETLSGPGEFLRVAFLYRGDPPSLDQFSLISMTAAATAGAVISDFRADLNLQ